MTEQTTPQWQPIERLASIASHIDGMLEAAEEQYEALQLVLLQQTHALEFLMNP